MSTSTAAIGSQTASFSLIDVDIKQAALALQHHTGLPVTLERKVSGSITLVSKKPLDALGAVTLLAAVAREKGWYPEIGVQGSLTIRATPMHIGDLVIGSIVTRKYPILYRSATEVSPHLRKLLSPRGSISAVDDRALLIQDEQRVHSHILHKLVEIDVEGAADTHYVKLQFAQAADVADALHRLAASSSEPRLSTVEADISANSLTWQSSDAWWNERLRSVIASFEKDAKLVAALGNSPLPLLIQSTIDAHASENKAFRESPAMHIILPVATKSKSNAISANQEAIADYPDKDITADPIRQFRQLNSAHLIELQPSPMRLIMSASLAGGSGVSFCQADVQENQCIPSLAPPTSYREHTDACCTRDAIASESNTEWTKGLSLKMTQRLSQFAGSPPH